jgi:hypothetical protein
VNFELDHPLWRTDESTEQFPGLNIPELLEPALSLGRCLHSVDPADREFDIFSSPEAALSTLARKQKTCATKTRLTEITDLLENAGGQGSSSETAAFLERFTLYPREDWGKTPEGVQSRDWYPWLFRRRLSLLARPLVRLDESAESPVLFSVGLMEQSLRYVVGGAYQGDFDSLYFRSAEMRQWIGSANHARGNEFNCSVTERFRELGLNARTVSMTEFGHQASGLDDIDVLAWRNDVPIVFIVECKRLNPALTVGEVASQLGRFRGEEKDLLDKYMRRYRFLVANKHNLGRLVAFPGTLFEVYGLLVTNTIVPMQFRVGLPIVADDIVPLKGLDSKIASILSASGTKG